MDKIKNMVETNKTLKLIITLASFVLPTIFLLGSTGSIDSEFFMFFNWLWIGFYSSVFLMLFIKKIFGLYF